MIVTGFVGESGCQQCIDDLETGVTGLVPHCTISCPRYLKSLTHSDAAVVGIRQSDGLGEYRRIEREGSEDKGPYEDHLEARILRTFGEYCNMASRLNILMTRHRFIIY